MKFVITYPSLLILCIVLVGCSVETQPTDTQSEQEVSWEEKAIAGFGFAEKDLDLGMEEIMSKQKTCEEYAEEMNYTSYSSVMQWSHKNKYSPRFDRCFSLREFFDSEDFYVIFDVLTGEGLISGTHETCLEVMEKRDYSAEELRDICTSHSDVLNIWIAITKQ